MLPSAGRQLPRTHYATDFPSILALTGRKGELSAFKTTLSQKIVITTQTFQQSIATLRKKSTPNPDSPTQHCFHHFVFLSVSVPKSAQKTTALRQKKVTEGSESCGFPTGAPQGSRARASHKVTFSAKSQIPKMSKISIHLYTQVVNKYSLSMYYIPCAAPRAWEPSVIKTEQIPAPLEFI